MNSSINNKEDSYISKNSSINYNVNNTESSKKNNSEFLDLKNLKIDDYEKFFDNLIKKNSNVKELDLSGNIFNYFPKDLSYFKKLESLIIKNIAFTNSISFEELVSRLQTLPRLYNLVIDLENNSEAEYILKVLPNLISLNNVSTKDDNHLVDLNDDKFISLDLNNYLPDFYDIFKEISNVLTDIIEITKDNKNKDEYNSLNTVLYSNLKSLIKKEISKITNDDNNKNPVYYNASAILNSSNKIYYFLLNIINDNFINIISQNNDFNKFYSIIIKIQKEINNRIYENSNTLHEIIYSLYPKINDKALLLRNKLEVAQKDANEIEEELNNLNDIINKKNKEKEELVKFYNDDKEYMLNKINILESENKLFTKNAIKKANDLLKTNELNDKLLNDSLSEKQNIKELNKKFDHSVNLNNNNCMVNNSQIIITTRVLTIKMLKDMIQEIYDSKENFDNKCMEYKMPRETMEQHMYSHLNTKYGLKVR